MTEYRLVAEPRVDLDVASYDRIAAGPFEYQDLRSGIRRALLRRFPYAVYFAVEGNLVIVAKRYLGAPAHGQ